MRFHVYYVERVPNPHTVRLEFEEIRSALNVCSSLKEDGKDPELIAVEEVYTKLNWESLLKGRSYLS